MTTTSLRFRPLPAPLPDLDELPVGAVHRVVADGGSPCRRCLRDATPGEPMLLLSYDPFLGDSPFRQGGPIFVHAAACSPDPADLVRAPEQIRTRLLSVRGFDAEHLQVATAVTEGAQIEDVATQMLADPAVSYLHVHNAAPGCFAVRVELVTR